MLVLFERVWFLGDFVPGNFSVSCFRSLRGMKCCLFLSSARLKVVGSPGGRFVVLNSSESRCFIDSV